MIKTKKEVMELWEYTQMGRRNKKRNRELGFNYDLSNFNLTWLENMHEKEIVQMLDIKYTIRIRMYDTWYNKETTITSVSLLVKLEDDSIDIIESIAIDHMTNKEQDNIDMTRIEPINSITWDEAISERYRDL